MVEVTNPRLNKSFLTINSLLPLLDAWLISKFVRVIQHLAKHHTYLYIEVLRIEEVDRTEIFFWSLFFFFFKLLG